MLSSFDEELKFWTTFILTVFAIFCLLLCAYLYLEYEADRQLDIELTEFKKSRETIPLMDYPDGF
jgi:hypothetical protein